MDSPVVEWKDIDALRDGYRKADSRGYSLFNIDRLLTERDPRYARKAHEFNYQVYLFFSRIKSKNYQVNARVS